MSAFINEQRASHAVEFICETIGVSASAHHARQVALPSARAIEDERLLTVIRQAHKDNYYAYGYRRMWKVLLRAGETAPRCQVQRLMREHGIVGAKRRGKAWRTTIPGDERAQAPDLLERDFTADAPNEVWVADFTYLRCWQGAVFFSFVIDVYSRRIVGWQLACHMRTSLVQDALDMAAGARDPDQEALTIHHSDRGSQAIYEWGLHAGDGRPRHPRVAGQHRRRIRHSVTMAESFADTFKTELISDRIWRTPRQLEYAIVKWVGWFNNQRLHGSLDDVPPAEFEAAYDDDRVAVTGSPSGLPGHGHPQTPTTIHQPN